MAAFFGLLAWIAHARRRRKTTKTDWDAQLIDAYAKGAALHDAMAAAAVPGALSSADGAARWSDIQRRADDFGQLLYTLRETAVEDTDRIHIASVIASLQAARSALEAERSAEDAGGTLSDVVRDRLSFFSASLRDLREPHVRPV